MSTSDVDSWRVVLDGSTVPTGEAVGNKARSIALMKSLGLNVPAAFAIPVSVGSLFSQSGELAPEAWDAVRAGVAELEALSGLKFGSHENPLLVSVRSGAAQSMPGMMDTILDLGINPRVERALAQVSGDPAFAHDTYMRFLESYARTVLGSYVSAEPQQTPADLAAAIYLDCGVRIPVDPYEQLRGAIEAVFRSWSSSRAKAYRKYWGLSDDGGTAVTVQQMVYGNLDDDSGTGVLFTRNPHAGTAEPLGEFLPRGQGEDVVSGEVDPLDLKTLRERMPTVHEELLAAGRLLEQQAGDVQDVEFTVERGRLFLLQTRNAKRSAIAAVKFAVTLADEGLSTRQQALERVKPAHVEALFQPVVATSASDAAKIIARGEATCPGFATGLAVTDSDEAVRFKAAGTAVILVRRSTSPEDIEGMIAAEGICTEVGGRTSHAAVVSRELGRPAVVGCGAGTADALSGRIVTVDGTTGVIYDGALALSFPDVDSYPELAKLARWAADNPGTLDPEHPLMKWSGNYADHTMAT